MTRRLRPATQQDVHEVHRAIDLLCQAREILKTVGAQRTADKVRRAIKSAGGALRHTERAAMFSEIDDAVRLERVIDRDFKTVRGGR